MKKLTCLLSFSLLAGAALTANADTLVLRNGVLWDNTFEGDVADLTTSDPVWSIFDRNGNASESSDGDIYSYVSDAVGDTVSYTAPSWAGIGSARTTEIRVRVPNDTFEATDGSGALITGVVDAYDLRIFHDSVTLSDNGELEKNRIAIDMTEFHILRAVVDDNATFKYTLYIDNDPTPVLQSNDTTFTGFDNLVFGDISTGQNSGSLDVDYISWTAGAFPVPEPGSMALLGLGGLVMMLRQR